RRLLALPPRPGTPTRPPGPLPAAARPRRLISRSLRWSHTLRRWPPGRRSSIDEDDLPARSAEPVLGPEVEVAGRARQGLADAVEPLPMGVSNTTPSRSVGG